MKYNTNPLQFAHCAHNFIWWGRHLRSGWQSPRFVVASPTNTGEEADWNLPSHTSGSWVLQLYLRILALPPTHCTSWWVLRMGITSWLFIFTGSSSSHLVGAPIDVIKSDQPNAEYVDELHGKVMEALEQMFDKYKEEYMPNSANTKLIIH